MTCCGFPAALSIVVDADNTLEHDLDDSTSGNFCSLLLRLCSANRNETITINTEKAQRRLAVCPRFSFCDICISCSEVARQLYAKSEDRMGTEDDFFIECMAKYSHEGVCVHACAS